MAPISLLGEQIAVNQDGRYTPHFSELGQTTITYGAPSVLGLTRVASYTLRARLKAIPSQLSRMYDFLPSAWASSTFTILPNRGGRKALSP